MKCFNSFDEMFNAQSGLKKDMGVFNEVVGSHGEWSVYDFSDPNYTRRLCTLVPMPRNYGGFKGKQLAKITFRDELKDDLKASAILCLKNAYVNFTVMGDDLLVDLSGFKTKDFDTAARELCSWLDNCFYINTNSNTPNADFGETIVGPNGNETGNYDFPDEINSDYHRSFLAPTSAGLQNVPIRVKGSYPVE